MLKWARPIFKALAYGIAGGLIMAIIGFVWYLEDRPDLKIWHTAGLDEEFTVASDAHNFREYLELEARLFAQLKELVLDRIEPEDRHLINRFHRGAMADPQHWSPNWNRSFELSSPAPKAGVLLLHGMSDSPYSLRSLGQRLHEEGVWVIGLRLPGHGTAPSGLLTITGPDMAAAVRLAIRHLKDRIGERPLFIVGYSNGGALAVDYALTTLTEPELPAVDGITLISPSIGVTGIAAFAVWQARLGHLLGLPKLEWSDIAVEYDPFKYGSFAVNAGDVVYRLTLRIQSQLDTMAANGSLNRLPPILAFQSVVDATVSTPALVDGLFNRLPPGKHELVLFDVDRSDEIKPILVGDPEAAVAALVGDEDLTFTVSLITNENSDSINVVARKWLAGASMFTETSLGEEWPRGVFSLSHVALPISPADPLYGETQPIDPSILYLGNLALRGERGIFRVPAADMLRQRWNPFYAYLEERILRSMQLEE